MGFFANIKDGSSYANIYPNDKEALMLWFNQALIDNSADDFLYVYGAIKMAPGVVLSSTKEGLSPDTLVQVRLPKKDYEVNSKDLNGNWQKVKKEQSAADKRLIEQIEELEIAGKIWSGIFNYDAREQYVSNSQIEGQEILAESFDEWKSNEKCLLKDLPDQSAAQKKSWSGAKGQTEKERLAERKAFFMSELGDLVPECETIGDIWALLSLEETDKQQAILIKNTMNMVLQFFQ